LKAEGRNQRLIAQGFVLRQRVDRCEHTCNLWATGMNRPLRLQQTCITGKVECAPPAFDPVFDPSGAAIRSKPVPDPRKEQENRAFGDWDLSTFRSEFQAVRCPR
jgi:hypothetical protein